MVDWWGNFDWKFPPGRIYSIDRTSATASAAAVLVFKRESLCAFSELAQLAIAFCGRHAAARSHAYQQMAAAATTTTGVL